MDIELRNIDDIRPYEQNPRVNDQAVEAVAVSLREYGFSPRWLLRCHGGSGEQQHNRQSKTT